MNTTPLRPLGCASGRTIEGLLLAALVGALAGCENGPGAKTGFPPVKSPFPTAGKAAPDATTPHDGSKVTPDFAKGLMDARQLERENDLAGAREIYQRLIVSNPERYEAYHRLAVVADKQKRYREAVALYTQAIRLNPDPEIFNCLGYSYYLQGKLDKAESALLKAVSMQPANARFRINLGLAYGQQGRFDEAMDQFRRGGSEADAYYNMAFVLASRDEIDAAKNCLALAQAADPNHEQAREALRSFQEAESGKERGEAIAQKDGRRWVLHKESQDAAPDSILAQTASYDAPPAADRRRSSNGTMVPAARGDTQALLRRARSMMSQRMADRGDGTSMQ